MKKKLAVSLIGIGVLLVCLTGCQSVSGKQQKELEAEMSSVAKYNQKKDMLIEKKEYQKGYDWYVLEGHSSDEIQLLLIEQKKDAHKGVALLYNRRTDIDTYVSEISENKFPLHVKKEKGTIWLSSEEKPQGKMKGTLKKNGDIEFKVPKATDLSSSTETFKVTSKTEVKKWYLDLEEKSKSENKKTEQRIKEREKERKEQQKLDKVATESKEKLENKLNELTNSKGKQFGQLFMSNNEKMDKLMEQINELKDRVKSSNGDRDTSSEQTLEEMKLQEKVLTESIRKMQQEFVVVDSSSEEIDTLYKDYVTKRKKAQVPVLISQEDIRNTISQKNNESAQIRDNLRSLEGHHKVVVMELSDLEKEITYRKWDSMTEEEKHDMMKAEPEKVKQLM